MRDMGPKADNIYIVGVGPLQLLFCFGLLRSVTLFCFGLLRGVTIFSQKSVTLFFFPFLEKEALHLVVEEDNYWASIESIDMHE